MYRLLPLLAIILFSCNQKKENSAISKQLDEFLTGQQKYFRFNGNVLVAENGKIVFQKSYGYANFDSQRLLNDSSVFELASVSKQFTATGILILKDQGKLQLTDSLRKFFPELPYSNITIWNMLTHTSGLPDYESAMNEKWDRKKIAFNNDMIGFLAKEKLPVLFAPGAKWMYSNTAYAILASIIEKISGESFQNFMAQTIFQPLSMKHTRIYNTRRSVKDTIANYGYGFLYNDSLQKHILPDSLPDFSFVYYLDGIVGDGCVNSTTADLLKWDRAVKNSKYGFGLFMDKNDFGTIISHSGGWPGYATFLARNADKDQTYIILSNNESPSPRLCLSLQNIMAGKPVVTAYEHKEIKMDSMALEPFTGKYKTIDNEISLERRGNKLFRVSPNGQSIELKPESANKFFYSDGSDRQIEFETDASKKINNVWLVAFGIKSPLQKIL
jgi:CubicO group peptidase (beta-lactamase class C family)